MQPDGVKLYYFKHRLFDLTEFIVRNNKGLYTDHKDSGICKNSNYDLCNKCTHGICIFGIP